MTDLATKIKVMQAALDGKTIQAMFLNISDEWDDQVSVVKNWNWEALDYRIKQEPMEFWVNIYDGGAEQLFFNSKMEAINAAGNDVQNTILLREVTDEK